MSVPFDQRYFDPENMSWTVNNDFSVFNIRGKAGAYDFFFMMCCREFAERYPNESITIADISEKCAEKWVQMTPGQKKRFEELEEMDARRYEIELLGIYNENPNPGTNASRVRCARQRKPKKKKNVCAKNSVLPKAPKRALNAYIIFTNVKRSEIKQLHPDWGFEDTAKELGRMWRELSEDEKAIYYEKAAADKIRADREMCIFREKNGKKLEEAP